MLQVDIILLTGLEDRHYNVYVSMYYIAAASVCVRACVHACVRACVHTYVHACVCAYVRACVNECLCVCVCPPFFDTTVGPQPNLEHTYSERYRTASNLTKLAPLFARKAGLIYY